MPASTLGAGEAARGDEGRVVLTGLLAVPGGQQLLDAVADRDDAELIGGATRDLLLGRAPRELDVVVEHGAAELARELAGALPAQAVGDPDAAVTHGSHERFETAFLIWSGGRIDIATRRTESYASPGALPDVRPGGPEEDLMRRDFTVNAIAVALRGARAGELRAPQHALEDLRARRLRVLHDGSFLDDPTRLMRLARYCARLGFEAEEHTALLARQALDGGALDTISPARLGAELRLALREPDPLAALAALERLGVLAAMPIALRFDEQLARRALALLPADGRADLLLLAGLLLEPDERSPGLAPKQFLDELEFTAAERDRACTAAARAAELREQLAAAPSPSAIAAAVRGAPLEAVALAAAIDEQQAPSPAAGAARQWFGQLRQVQLQIGGDDLLAAGLPSGPDIGRRLDAVLDLRLDGRVGDTRAAQLEAALAVGKDAQAGRR